MVGQTLSHFKVVDKLGQGGMGVVYRGMDLNLDRPVAIKILPPGAEQDEDAVGRFLREAKTASKLQHPCITTIYEFGVKDEMRYLVMEYIEGKTLREMLKKGPLPVRQAVEIVMQMADALGLAGEKAIIHRDIKSENVMLTERGQVKILDFGLAKMVEKSGVVAHDTFQTAQGTVIGTISYMSPEQALGAELDCRSDIYSTGVVLFEMVTGTLPFTGTSPNVVLAKILNQPAPSPSDYSPEVPPGLEKVIAKCLEKNRDQRYQTALHLLVDLKALKQQVESMKDWGGTVVAQPGAGLQPSAVENLRELVPQTPSAAPASAAGSGTVVTPRVVLAPPPAAGGVSTATSGTLRAAAAMTASQRAWRLRSAFAVKALRKVIAAAGALYALGCLALFAMPLVRVERVASLPFIRYLHDMTDPVLGLVTNLVNFNFIYHNFNFLFAGLALAVYIVRGMVTGFLEKVEVKIRKPLKVQASISGVAMPQAALSSSGVQQASRMSLLRDYAAAKRILSEAKKEMTFLSADVVGSTKMKVGEDKIVIEHAFSEYKKFLERIFREFRVYKVAWTPDGVMTCFPSVDDAASAARKLLTDLDWFNHDVHQLRAGFTVRCGLNIGEVMVPDTKPLEEISDEVIDVAGHLQKYADPNTLWVSGEAYQRLLDRNGFTRQTTQVDNREVYAWRKPAP